MSCWKANQRGTITTEQILASADGSGNCNVWSTFFRDVIRTQGIEANMTEVRPIIPNTANDEKVLAVKEWNFKGSGSAPAPYSYLIGIDATPGNAGTEGQNNHNPPKQFNVHYVTLSGSIVYDPSYGTPAVGTSIEDYEDSAFAGYGKYIVQPPSGTKIAFRKNDSTSNSQVEVTLNLVDGQ